MYSNYKMDKICATKLDDIKLKTGKYHRTCRYHRKPGQKFYGSQLVPPGCCPHLFMSAYPFSLSLLYDSKYLFLKGAKRSVCVSCPSKSNPVHVKVFSKFSYPAIIRKLKNFAIKMLQYVNVPAEYPDKNVYLKVMNDTGCPFGLKKGSIFKFNLKNRTELCPASFYNLYPLLLRPSKEEDGMTCLHCPDPYGVFYHIKGKQIDCNDFLSLKFVDFDQNPKATLIKDKLPGKFCPLAFFSIYPYILTNVQGGRFEWVRKGEYVRVQCPVPNGIMMEAELGTHRSLGSGEVKVRIIRTSKSCPRNFKKGEVFVFNTEKNGKLYRNLASVIPLKYAKSETFSCSGCDEDKIELV